MNIPQILTITRQQCDYPDPQRPTDDHLMLALRKCSQELHNRLGVALPAWDISYVDVTAGSGDYVKSLNLTSIGKVRRCYAMLIENDQSALNCPVKIIDPDETNLYQGSAAIAEAVAMFYRDGGWKAQFAPPLTNTYTYRLWYEVGELPWYGRSDTPIPQIDSYHYLLADLMTVEVLPHCWWSKLLEKEVEMKVGDKQKLMAAHRQMLSDRSEKAIARQFPVFQEAISTLLASQEPSPNGYGDSFGDFDSLHYFS